MSRLRLTKSDGSKVFVDDVEGVEFEKVCPYNGHAFFTASLVRIHCCDAHKNAFLRKFPPELRADARGANSTPLTHHSV